MMTTISKTHVCYNNKTMLKRIDLLGLTIRTLNALLSEDIKYVGQLVVYTEQWLLKIPNIGRKALGEIKITLENEKLSLNVPCSKGLQTIQDIEEFFCLRDQQTDNTLENLSANIILPLSMDTVFASKDIDYKNPELLSHIQTVCQKQFEHAVAQEVYMALDNTPDSPHIEGHISFPAGDVVRLPIALNCPEKLTAIFKDEVFIKAARDIGGVTLYPLLEPYLESLSATPQ